jgi:hypothetical protein
MAEIRIGGTYGVGSITLREAQFAGEGGPTNPRLVIPLHVAMHSRPTEQMLALTFLSCALHPVTPTVHAHDGNQLGAAAVADFGSPFECRSLPQGPCEVDLPVRVPLTLQTLAMIEAHRHAMGGDFVAVLRLRGSVDWLYRTGNSFPNTPTAKDASGMPEHTFDPGMGMFSITARFWNVTIENLDVRVPASHWVQNVLPALGLDRIRIIEIALPEADSLLPADVIRTFDAARRECDLGRYRECIERCRDVRNLVENSLGATRQHPIAARVSERMGWAADAPQRAFLETSWKAFADLTNASHHISQGARLVAADARACLLQTVTLLEYLTRIL